MSALIEFQGFNKFYGEQQVLNGIDLQVKSGEVIVILGPSGCGKSTLLRCSTDGKRHSGSCGCPANSCWKTSPTGPRVLQGRGPVFRVTNVPHMSVLTKSCWAR